MDKDRGVRMLHRWFGDDPFQVRNVNDTMVLALEEPFDMGARTVYGKRIQLGRVLSAMDGHRCRISDDRLGTFVVVEPADDSIPGTYQIQ